MCDRVIYFVTTNELKERELRNLWSSQEYELKIYKHQISEIQSSSVQTIAIDKAKKAYKALFRPVLVEHSGLLLKEYGNLPGGLTQIVWDSLTEGTNAEKFCELFAKNGETPAIAKTVFSYCDGKKIYSFDGTIEGKVVYPPRGSNSNYWDCAFQPSNDSHCRTFAEMDIETKNTYSMRAHAIKKFMNFLNPNFHSSEVTYDE